MAEGIISEYTFTEDGLMIRKDTQDADPIMSDNTKERNSGENQNRYANARKVASIPLVTVEYLKKRPMSEGGPIDLNLLGTDVEHTMRFVRWLNDRDNSKFRTSEARVGHGIQHIR